LVFIKQFKNEIVAKQFRIFLTLLVLTTLFTATFSISWFIENQILKWINTFGVLLQLVSFLYFYKMLQPQISQFKANINSITKLTYVFALSALFLKITLQFVVLALNLTEVSHQIRNWVIGFIHLTTLGIITGFLFGILVHNNLLPRKAYLLKIGVKCFFFGYVITEMLLFLQGFLYYSGKGLLFSYYEALFGSSIFIVAGLLFILISLFKTKIRVN
jgi:hypothetical protein